MATQPFQSTHLQGATKIEQLFYNSNKEFLLSSDLVEAGKVETPERMSQAPAFRRG